VTRTSRRRLFAVAALLAAAPVLAACGAGEDANLAQPYSPTEAAHATKNGITITQAFVLGPDSGATIAPGSAAPLYLTMVNGNPTADQLIGITTDAQMATSAKAAQAITLPPGVLVNTGNPSPQIVLDGTKTALYGGESTRLTLRFQNAGEIMMDVPVITRSREFDSLPPAPSPSPSTAASTSASATPAPSASTSASPTP
jgi:copper(I)-binding protein